MDGTYRLSCFLYLHLLLLQSYVQVHRSYPCPPKLGKILVAYHNEINTCSTSSIYTHFSLQIKNCFFLLSCSNFPSNVHIVWYFTFTVTYKMTCVL